MKPASSHPVQFVRIAKNYSRPGLGRYCVGLLLALVLAGSTAAHHAISSFDLERERTVRGTVVAFDWVNPHVRTVIETEDEPGNRLSFEGMTPDYLGRRGWTRYTLKPGDGVEITYFPYHDGAPGGMLVRAKLADGTLKVMIDND
jgi:hypothetical protein